MKKLFINPEIEAFVLSAADVMAASNEIFIADTKTGINYTSIQGETLTEDYNIWKGNQQ